MVPILSPILIAILSLVWPPIPAQQQQAIPRATSRNPHGAFNQTCENCHTFTTWRPIRNLPEFDHDKTRYPLRGMHANVTCTQCHTRLLFSNVGKKCADCHADMHRGQNGTACDTCHTVKGWRVSVQAIQQHQNRFPLLGAHSAIECDACHTQAAAGRFQGLSATCYTCHAKDFQNPAFDHRAMGFATTCQTCHNMTSWLGAKFDHARLAGFALTGAHANLDCKSCHVSGTYKGTPANCFSCHSRDYNSAVNPNHAQSGFPRECATCHTTSTWTGAKFDHNTFAKFALTGMHANLQCAQCHVNGKYAGTPADCVSCHVTDFNRTTNPNHVQAGFPRECATCHTTTTWTGATFNHNTSTKFALTGMHANLQCAQCHVNGKYARTPADCASCHVNDFNRTTNPNHVQAGFPRECATCHTTSTWSGAKFDHNTSTKFPLTGMHANLQCTQCHVNGKYAGTPANCASCHVNDYNRTTNPNHKASGFPTDCSICHTTRGWQPASFDHSRSAFPLTGAHSKVACASCHINGNFSSTPTACSSCHLSSYNSTTNPNHKAAGFPTDCQVCHSTSAWQPASFDHSKTGFPLTGAHVNVTCTNCHVGGRYAGTPADCYSCHKTEYQGTTNPNHIAAQFPTTCLTCHTTSRWTGAKFNHTWFPIFSGTHSGKWSTCSDCHVNSSNYAVFSCTNCHEHDKSRVDPKHRGVGGYSYGPTTCYSCHPTGKGD